VLLLNGEDLFAEGLIDERERVGRRSVRGGVVDGVGSEEEIALAEVVVEACRAEVFADMLDGVGVCGRDAGGEACRGVDQLRPVLYGPQVEQRSYAGGYAYVCLTAFAVGNITLTGAVVGNQGYVGEAEVLAVALVVTEEKELVVAQGPPSDPP